METIDFILKELANSSNIYVAITASAFSFAISAIIRIKEKKNLRKKGQLFDKQ